MGIKVGNFKARKKVRMMDRNRWNVLFLAVILFSLGCGQTNVQAEEKDVLDDCLSVARGDFDTLSCLVKETERFELKARKLNKVLLEKSGPDDRKLIIAFRESWIHLRQSICGKKLNDGGTIARVEAQFCILDITEKHVSLLEAIDSNI